MKMKVITVFSCRPAPSERRALKATMMSAHAVSVPVPQSAVLRSVRTCRSPRGGAASRDARGGASRGRGVTLTTAALPPANEVAGFVIGVSFHLICYYG